MKKIITLLVLMLTVNFANALSGDTIYKDIKSVCKNDLSNAVAYTADKGEEGVKYLFGKADTVLNTAYNAITKGSIHTYQILKTQQLVKSFHHLFYFTLGILMTFLVYYRIKLWLKDDTQGNGTILFLTICTYVALTGYNTYNFNEMLTGFINPEYGAMTEILQLMKQIK